MPLDQGNGRTDPRRQNKVKQKEAKQAARKGPPPPPSFPSPSQKSVERPGSSSQTRNPQSLRSYPWLHANSGIDWRNVNVGLLQRLNALGKAVGEVITITSGFRSHAQQRQLYYAYQSGQGGLAAPPGSSNHEYGLAVDALIGGRAVGDVVPESVLNQIGLHSLAGIGDSVHVELANASEIRGAGGGTAPPPASYGEGVSQPAAAPAPPISSGSNVTQESSPAPVESANMLPFETDEGPPLLDPVQRSETWQLISSLPGASPETQTLARLARLGAGGQ